MININKEIVLISDKCSKLIDDYDLIEGLSEEAGDPRYRIKVISTATDRFLFTKAGCAGFSVKRKVVGSGLRKVIDLYPKRIKFKILSLELLTQAI